MLLHLSIPAYLYQHHFPIIAVLQHQRTYLNIRTIVHIRKYVIKTNKTPHASTVAKKIIYSPQLVVVGFPNHIVSELPSKHNVC